MTWNDQAATMSNMMKTWADAQRQLWENWSQMMWNPMGQMPMGQMSMGNLGSLNTLWRDMIVQGMRAWTANTDPSVGNLAEGMFASQNAMMRFWELATNAWQTILPNVQNGQDWQTAIGEFTNTLREQLTQASMGGVGSVRSMTELWQSSLNQWQMMGMPWASAMQNAMGMMGNAAGGNPDAIHNLSELYWDAYQNTFGQFLSSPALGLTRELEAKFRNAAAAFQNYQRANYDYQVITSDIWVQAFEQFMHELVNLTEQGEAITGIRDMLNRWSVVADDVFQKAFRTEEYIVAQGNLMKTSLEFRMKQREITEYFLRSNDMPTLSDLDETNKELYHMRKEIKALKAAVAELQAAAPAKSSSSRRSSSSSRKAAAKQEETPETSEEQ